MFKQSSRINTDLYSQTISKIVDDAIEKGKNKWYRDDHDFLIGTYQIRHITLDVNGSFKDVPIGAGLEIDKKKDKNYQIYIYYNSFAPLNSLKFYTELSDVLHHEITHVIDSSYQPLLQHSLDDQLEDFRQEFQQLYIHGAFGGSVTYQDTLSKQLSIEESVKRKLKKLVDTKVFKDLLKKFELKLTTELYSQLYKLMLQINIEDSSFMMHDPMGVYKDDETVKTEGFQLYYNSEAEVKAYLTNIFREMYSFLWSKEGTQLRDAAISKPLSSLVETVLNKCPSWEDIEPYLFEKNKRFIRKEIGRYLLSLKGRPPLQIIENRLGIKLTPQDRLAYRYLLSLYNKEEDDMLFEKIKTLGKDFPNAVLTFKNHLKQLETLEDILNKVKSL